MLFTASQNNKKKKNHKWEILILKTKQNGKHVTFIDPVSPFCHGVPATGKRLHILCKDRGGCSTQTNSFWERTKVSFAFLSISAVMGHHLVNAADLITCISPSPPLLCLSFPTNVL